MLCLYRRDKKWSLPLFVFSALLVFVFSLKGLFWIVQIMLAPVLMTLLLCLLTFVLAKLEFRR